MFEQLWQDATTFGFILSDIGKFPKVDKIAIERSEVSYTSESVLPVGTTLGRLQEIISLLDYRKVSDDQEVPTRVGSYFWYEPENYASFVGVELDVYRTRRGDITVTTRSRSSRSYWDLAQQNKTIKLIRDLFGGHFRTDAGRNRYLRLEGSPPSPLASGCFLARWRFHNDLIRARIYLMARKFDPTAKDKPTGLNFLDEINPRLLSNNLLLPYFIAVWEEYFRATFAVLFKCAAKKEAVLRNARIDHTDLEQMAAGAQPVERAVAESFSFQRPSSIDKNFKLLARELEVAAVLRKPFRSRKMSLFDSIERLIDVRNEFVHTGTMDIGLFDEQLTQVSKDLEVAVNRVYEHVSKHYKSITKLFPRTFARTRS
jgi:hypothetical protein